jgi:leucine dehydrogenase
MSITTEMSKDTKFEIFNQISTYDHEQVLFCQDQATNLKAIIAIHNTTLGPGLGGTRMYNYKNDSDALTDVLRLSRGMTYKAAITGLNLGGAKAVIMGDPSALKSEALMRKFGRFIKNLNGKYITAEDVGTTTKDMEYISMETKYVVGLPEVRGGGGDPSPVTAYGVYLGMKASAKKAYGSESLEGKKILVEGIGKVGSHLVELIHKEGAKIFIADISESSLHTISKKYDATIVDLNNVPDADIDIYAPCALGASLNDNTIPRLKCNIVAGAANNQLANEERDGNALRDRGILYAPDYLINAGGLVNVYTEYNGYNKELALSTAENIYDTTIRIIEKAQKDSISTYLAANIIAEERINQIGKVKSTY